MSDLYLIAHLARGEPTFDIAEKQACPLCDPAANADQGPHQPLGCDECSGSGHWWILSTPGYRAYPWWTTLLEDCTGPMRDNSMRRIHISLCGDPPSDSPDIFACNDRPSTTAAPTGAKALLAKLGLIRPSAPIKRRL